MRVLIIGGGASGSLLALHLARRSKEKSVQIVIIEKQKMLGFGLAYSTRDPSHLLNVRAKNMSAFADEPDHFIDWLKARSFHQTQEEFADYFAPRQLYGEYISELINHAKEKYPSIEIIQGECVSIDMVHPGFIATLKTGETIQGDRVVLAVGNDMQTTSEDHLVSPWSTEFLNLTKQAKKVLIIGSGLSMVDTTLSLIRNNFQGKIIALSRHGYLSQAHAHTAPWAIDQNSIPLSKGLLKIFCFVRNEIFAAKNAGKDWRSVIDALRPHTSLIWQSLSVEDKRRFFAHVRPLWDCHRHRMAPDIAAEIHKLIETGRLTLIAGEFISHNNRINNLVQFRPRSSNSIQTLQCDVVVGCRGLALDPARSAMPLIRKLFNQGVIRSDPISIGIELNSNCCVVGKNGEINKNIFAIGPQSRAQFWESIAIPDIRNQVRILTEHLLKDSL